MAKKNQKRKLVGLVSEVTGARKYYTTRRNDGEKISIMKYNPDTMQHERFTETKKNLGRNEVKKRK
jgi:ribosomal protein L33